MSRHAYEVLTCDVEGCGKTEKVDGRQCHGVRGWVFIRCDGAEDDLPFDSPQDYHVCPSCAKRLPPLNGRKVAKTIGARVSSALKVVKGELA